VFVLIRLDLFCSVCCAIGMCVLGVAMRVCFSVLIRVGLFFGGGGDWWGWGWGGGGVVLTGHYGIVSLPEWADKVLPHKLV